MKYNNIKKFLFRLIIVLLVTSCTTNPNQCEQIDQIGLNEGNLLTINNTDNIIQNNNISYENIVLMKNINNPFDPVEFVQGLYSGMEIVNIYIDKNFENWIELLGNESAGRHYFDYITPLYSRPINSSDETVFTVNNQARIARQLNPGYNINLDIDISNFESKELEKRTLAFNIQYGTRIQDYRKEGEIKYILKDNNGLFRYGAYVVTSAIITQNRAEANTYNAIKEWLENTERSEVFELLEKLFKK